MDFDMKAKKERLLPSYEEVQGKDHLDNNRKEEVKLS
jgi:hypothetical protein